MTTTVLLIGALIVAANPDPTAKDLAAYQQADATVGRDPDAHVRLALWCEAHGLNAERLKHLARAVLADPAHATARGLLGLVAYQGQWKRPEAVARKVQSDDALTARLAEYNARRGRARDTADAQWTLALWCAQNGLDAEAQAHFTAVTRLDPSREAAWKRLGYRKANGRWTTDARLAAERDEAEAQKKADRHWKPLLTKYRNMLTDKAKRDAAEAALAAVSDPRAVPSVWSVFVAGSSSHEHAVQILGQIDAASSSRALAMLAVFDDSAEVRRAATETLKRRDPREFAGMLVALLRDPLKYQVKPVGGPGSPGAIFVEGERFNVQRLYLTPSLPPQVRIFADNVPFDPFSPVNLWRAMIGSQFTNGSSSFEFGNSKDGSPRAFDHGKLPAFLDGSNLFASAVKYTDIAAFRDVLIARNIMEVQRAAASSAQQLSNDIGTIEAFNDQARAVNGRVASVLNSISGESLGESRKDWVAWLTNMLGYARKYVERPKPTVAEAVAPGYLPQINMSMSKPFQIRLISCFGAGTLVRTLDGSKPIETIQVGDRVLTLDVKTGALGYHPVTVIYHNPPSPTSLVKVGKDTIVSSPFHRFWIAGAGWKMARDLKGGETLRLLDGPARVDSVEEGPVQLVYNLDVAGDHDFFAGAAAALVHDNTLPDTRLVAFDAAPAAAVAESSGR